MKKSISIMIFMMVLILGWMFFFCKMFMPKDEPSSVEIVSPIGKPLIDSSVSATNVGMKDKIISNEWLKGLKLVGVIFADADTPVAVIEDLFRDEVGCYEKGGMLRGAIVIRITSDKVELLKNGRISVLYLKEAEPMLLEGEEDYIEVISANEWKVKKERLFQRAGGIGALINQVRVVPVIRSGKVIGFKLKHIQRNSVVRRVGIQEGDIVKKVNGIAVVSIPKAFEIYREHKHKSLVKVGIERKAQDLTLTYYIE